MRRVLDASLYILCGALLIGTLWRGGYFPEPKWTFTFLLLVATGWELVVFIADGKKNGTLRSPALWLFLAFAVFATYSIFWTVTLGDTEREAALLLAYTGVIFVVRSHLARSGRKALTLFGNWFVYAASFVSVWGIATYILRISPYAIVVDNIYRAGSTFEYSNALACFGLMALPVTAALFRLARPGERPWLGVAVTLQAAAVILSFSRFGVAALLLIGGYIVIAASRDRLALDLLFSLGGALAVALAAAVALETEHGRLGLLVAVLLLAGVFLGHQRAAVSENGKDRWTIVAMLGTLLAAAIASVLLMFRVERLKTVVAARFEEGLTLHRLLPHRLDTWTGAVDSFRAKPLTGSGLGSFYFVYQQYAMAAYTKYAHNLVLQTAVETGLAGAALMVVFLGYVTALSVWRLLAGKDLLARAFAISALAFMIYNMFDWEWYVPALTAWFMLAVACTEGVKQPAARVEEVKPAGPR